jgi:hypothetical protein
MARAYEEFYRRYNASYTNIITQIYSAVVSHSRAMVNFGVLAGVVRLDRDGSPKRDRLNFNSINEILTSLQESDKKNKTKFAPEFQKLIDPINVIRKIPIEFNRAANGFKAFLLDQHKTIVNKIGYEKIYTQYILLNPDGAKKSLNGLNGDHTYRDDDVKRLVGSIAGIKLSGDDDKNMSIISSLLTK